MQLDLMLMSSLSLWCAVLVSLTQTSLIGQLSLEEVFVLSCL